MNNLIGSNIGLIHVIAALVATVAGTIVILSRTGTKFHKQVGYTYAISMLVLNITAFMTYRLFGTIGIFPYAAILSLLTLIGGMVPAIRRTNKNWIYQHFSLMYWSVIGLYAAFASEALTRIPETPFFGMVGIATALITLIGALFFIKCKKTWRTQFAKLTQP